jgi:hypothetical protein
VQALLTFAETQLIADSFLVSPLLLSTRSVKLEAAIGALRERLKDMQNEAEEIKAKFNLQTEPIC